MCFWIPAAVLSTFPQFFQRHLNITFMEFWRRERTGEQSGNEPANAVGPTCFVLPLYSKFTPTSQHEWADPMPERRLSAYVSTRQLCCSDLPLPAVPRG